MKHLIFFVSLLLSLPSLAKPFKVLLDPGHGGHDSGTVQGELQEKNITLSVAELVKSRIEKESNFEVNLTRTSDRFVHLDRRKGMALELKPDLFLSIHVNSNANPAVTGTEFYFENQMASDDDSLVLAHRENAEPLSAEGVKKTGRELPAQEDVSHILTDLAHSDHMVKSQLLSQTLLDSFKVNFQGRTKTIRQAPFRVLLVRSPATLVELGFISNGPEAKWMAAATTQERMAEAIMKGIKTFKEKLDKIATLP